MKAVIDTCIIIDALQRREPFCEQAQAIFLLCANRQVDGFITAKAITDIYYLVHRQTHNNVETREVLRKLLTLFGLADTAAADINGALISDMSDFEDAVMSETALRIAADCIVTRNTKDYIKSSVRIYTPEEFISLLTDAI